MGIMVTIYLLEIYNRIKLSYYELLHLQVNLQFTQKIKRLNYAKKTSNSKLIFSLNVFGRLVMVDEKNI